MTNDDLLLASHKKIKEDCLPLFTDASNATWNTDFPEEFVYKGEELYGVPSLNFSQILTDSNKKYKITFKIVSTTSRHFYNTFVRCTNLTSVSFPKLTSITYDAFFSTFYMCTNLTSVSFPKVTSIKPDSFIYAFSGCTNLTSISFPKLTSADMSSFSQIGDSNLTIHVPKSLSDAGLSTGGSTCGTIVYDL